MQRAYRSDTETIPTFQRQRQDSHSKDGKNYKFRDYVINRRTGAPTFIGYVILILLVFLLAKYLFKSGSSVQEDAYDIKDELGFEEDENFVKLDEEEQMKIVEEQAENNPDLIGHQMPIFNMNNADERGHMEKRHRNRDEQIVKRFGQPRPKDPVKILIWPKLNCSEQEPIQLIILVQTSPGETGVRKVIRNTWGLQSPDSIEKNGRYKVVFTMGKSGTIFDDKVLKESVNIGDILQGDFMDSPLEGTRVIMMSMEWLTSEKNRCKPQFVLKTRDNIFHNMGAIMPWLKNKFESAENIYVGKMQRREQPERNADDPHYVAPDDFNKQIYPDMILGPTYLLSYDVVKKMYGAMLSTTPIAVEDAYVAILAEKINVPPKHNDHFQMLHMSKEKCHILQVFFIYNIQPYDHVKLQTKALQARTSDDCQGIKVWDKAKGLIDLEENDGF